MSVEVSRRGHERAGEARKVRTGEDRSSQVRTDQPKSQQVRRIHDISG